MMLDVIFYGTIGVGYAAALAWLAVLHYPGLDDRLSAWLRARSLYSAALERERTRLLEEREMRRLRMLADYRSEDVQRAELLPPVSRCLKMGREG